MLVFDGALVFLIARMVEAVAHGLVLKVAFAALVADRAVKRVIDQQEFHDPLARLLDAVGVGTHDHPLAGRQHDATGFGARSMSTRHIRQLPADRQAVVIAESAGSRRRLPHRHAERWRRPRPSTSMPFTVSFGMTFPYSAASTGAPHDAP